MSDEDRHWTETVSEPMGAAAAPVAHERAAEEPSLPAAAAAAVAEEALEANIVPEALNCPICGDLGLARCSSW